MEGVYYTIYNIGGGPKVFFADGVGAYMELVKFNSVETRLSIYVISCFT